MNSLTTWLKFSVFNICETFRNSSRVVQFLKLCKVFWIISALSKSYARLCRLSFVRLVTRVNQREKEDSSLRVSKLVGVINFTPMGQEMLVFRKMLGTTKLMIPLVSLFSECYKSTCIQKLEHNDQSKFELHIKLTQYSQFSRWTDRQLLWLQRNLISLEFVARPKEFFVNCLFSSHLSIITLVSSKLTLIFLYTPH